MPKRKTIRSVRASKSRRVFFNESQMSSAADENSVDVFDFDTDARIELALADFDKKVEEKISLIRQGTQKCIDEIKRIYELEECKYPPELLTMNFHEYCAMVENGNIADSIEKDVDSRINEKFKSTKPPPHTGKPHKTDERTKKILHVDLPEATPLDRFRGPKPDETIVYSVRGSLIMLDRCVGDRYRNKAPRNTRKK